MTINRISVVLTIIENDCGETYAINTESGLPIKDTDIQDIIASSTFIVGKSITL
jgi:hypothetical protein